MNQTNVNIYFLMNEFFSCGWSAVYSVNWLNLVEFIALLKFPLAVHCIYVVKKRLFVSLFLISFGLQTFTIMQMCNRKHALFSASQRRVSSSSFLFIVTTICIIKFIHSPNCFSFYLGSFCSWWSPFVFDTFQRCTRKTNIEKWLQDIAWIGTVQWAEN